MGKNLKDRKIQGEKEWVIHICTAPLGDGARIWIGEDPSKYVDCLTLPGGVAKAVTEWFDRYGAVILESWEEYFPEKARHLYLKRICKEGYTQEEAKRIIRYLPQTDSDFLVENVSQMISLWKAGVSVTVPKGTPRYKAMIALDADDVWSDEILSPSMEEAREEGRLAANNETESDKTGEQLK